MMTLKEGKTEVDSEAQHVTGAPVGLATVLASHKASHFTLATSLSPRLADQEQGGELVNMHRRVRA